MGRLTPLFSLGLPVKGLAIAIFLPAPGSAYAADPVSNPVENRVSLIEWMTILAMRSAQSMQPHMVGFCHCDEVVGIDAGMYLALVMNFKPCFERANMEDIGDLMGIQGKIPQAGKPISILVERSIPEDAFSVHTCIVS